jgi:hypothetical protein
MGAYVLEVGVRGVDLNTVVLIERHAPESVVLGLACDMELLPERVRCLWDFVRESTWLDTGGGTY